MDILAHSLWTNIMYKTIPQTRKNRQATYWGIFFGIFPDLVSFTPVFLYAIYAYFALHRQIIAKPPGTDNLFFNYALKSYNYSHSLVIWLMVLLIVLAMTKKFPWFLLGWGLHIGIDIFSHTEQFFSTPFLFPISGFRVSAVSWAHPVFMIINYGLLAAVYLFIIPKIVKRT